ncbi:rhodanese-like domain-containing protein [Lacinutrix salivirga]
MKYSIYLFVLLIVSLSSCTSDGAGEIVEITTEEMQTFLKMEDVQLIDVRTPKEYLAGTIDTAQNINFLSPTFDVDIQALDKDKPVLLFCQKGGRSAKCAKKMKALGFKKIYDLSDGYSKWKHKTTALTPKS